MNQGDKKIISFPFQIPSVSTVVTYVLRMGYQTRIMGPRQGEFPNGSIPDHKDRFIFSILRKFSEPISFDTSIRILRIIVITKEDSKSALKRAPFESSLLILIHQ